MSVSQIPTRSGRDTPFISAKWSTIRCLLDWETGKSLVAYDTRSSNTSGIAAGDGFVFMAANGPGQLRPKRPHDVKQGGRIVKLDANSLPDGSRVLSENPRVIRLTQALMSRVDFAVLIGEADNRRRCEAFPGGRCPDETPQFPPGITSVVQTIDPLLLEPRLDVLALSTPSVHKGALIHDLEFALYSNYDEFIRVYEVELFDAQDTGFSKPIGSSRALIFFISSKLWPTGPQTST